MSVNTLGRTLESAPIEKKILYKVQEGLKNEVRLGFRQLARANYPIINTTTCGTLLIYDQAPCCKSTNPEHGYVFEDMQYLRRTYRILGVGERIQYTKFMTLPMGSSPGDFPQKSLPKPVTIMIIVTNRNLTLYNPREGEDHTISLTMPQHLEVYGRMPTMIATYE